MYEKVYIIIPAKDEEPRIGKVLREIIALGFTHVVVVDDGSADRTAQIARSAGAVLLTHMVNLGPGAATQTGITYALDHGAQVIVTLDADAQHSPDDIPDLVQALLDEDLDVIVGSRFIQRQDGIPINRIIYNRMANLFTWLYTGVLMTDSQSGFKVMHRRFAGQVNILFNGFEFCTEFVSLMKKRRAKYREMPIAVQYSKETMQKGQSLMNGFRMVLSFLRRGL